MTKMIYLSQREFFLVINGEKRLEKAQDVLKCNKKARFNKINNKKSGRRNVFICPGFETVIEEEWL